MADTACAADIIVSTACNQSASELACAGVVSGEKKDHSPIGSSEMKRGQVVCASKDHENDSRIQIGGGVPSTDILNYTEMPLVDLTHTSYTPLAHHSL
jgi:hypothetical protein